MVSAVVTTHKRNPEILERAIKSIISQSYKDIEIIVIDDSPEDYPLRDAVKNMVSKYEEHNIKYIQHDTPKGACAARNSGIEIAQGEYVGFLDDDDEWSPRKIEKQLQGFDNENVALVYGVYELLYENTGKVICKKSKCLSGNIFDELMTENFIGSTSFPLIRKSALVDLNGFDVLMQSAQDYDMWLRLAQKYKVKFVDESMGIYHLHEGETITANLTKKLNGLERIVEKNIEYLRANKSAYWYRHTGMVYYYAKDRKLGKALKVWFKAVVRRPSKASLNFKNLINIFRVYFKLV